jgi:thymidylate synthase
MEDNIQTLILSGYSAKEASTINKLFQDIEVNDFRIENYQSYPGIKAKLITGL